MQQGLWVPPNNSYNVNAIYKSSKIAMLDSVIRKKSLQPENIHSITERSKNSITTK